MQPPTVLLALALALVPLVPGAQEGPTPVPAEPAKPRWPWGNEHEAERIRRDFCGVWQLARAEIDGLSFEGDRCHGYLLALPNYCSLQVQLLAHGEADPDLLYPGFAAGAYRWEYDAARLLLVWTTLIHGTDMDDARGRVDYERQGSRREFQVDLTGDELRLDRGGNNRLHFRRAQALVPPEPRRAKPPGEDR
jgi:hypothetical protein